MRTTDKFYSHTATALKSALEHDADNIPTGSQVLTSALLTVSKTADWLAKHGIELSPDSIPALAGSLMQTTAIEHNTEALDELREEIWALPSCSDELEQIASVLAGLDDHKDNT